MKNRMKAVGGVLVLGVVVAMVAQFLGGKNQAGEEPSDLPALRMELKEQVAEGRLTEAEAKAAFIEAKAQWDTEAGEQKQPASGMTK